jgi:glycosyltransferase involved in cell wall biosynthesis
MGPVWFLEQIAGRFVDKFVVLNRSVGDELAKRFRVSPSKVVVIPNGVGLERYDPVHPRSEAWRARLGIPNSAVLVGGIGRLVPEKVIAGDGPDWEELHALVDVFDLRDRVLLPGFVDDVPGFLADLDVFVLPSLTEEHPVVLLEAMAMACPVVATEIAGIGDTIADGIDGRLVVAGDVPSLAEAIGALLRDPTAARRFGRNARRKIEQEYTVESMVRRTAVLYEELLSGGR